MTWLNFGRKWFAGPVAAALLSTSGPGKAEPPPGPRAVKTLECYLIEKASIVEDRSTEGKFGLANVGHQIRPGRSWVLSIREYDDPDQGPDSQTFAKLTLELEALPNLPQPGREQDARVIKGYFTLGQEAFLPIGSYAWGAAPAQSLTLIRDSQGTRARVHAAFLVKEMRTGEVTRQQVAWNCPVIKRTVDQLDAWEGRPGTHAGSFYPGTPRRRSPPG